MDEYGVILRYNFGMLWIYDLYHFLFIPCYATYVERDKSNSKTGNDTLGGKILAGNTRAINLILNVLFFGLYIYSCSIFQYLL